MGGTKKNASFKNIVAVTVLVSLWLVMTSTLVGTSAAVVVKVDPPTQAVTAGDVWSVNVIVENVTKLGADQATLHFDPQAMSVSQVTEGDFLKSAGTTLGAGLEVIDNVNGQVTFFYSLTEQGSGITGSGTLATIGFDTDPSANSGDVFDLSLTNVLLVNGTGSFIPVDTIFNGTCAINGPEPTPTTPSGGGKGGISESEVQPQSITSEPEPEPIISPTPKPTVAVTPSPSSTEALTPIPSEEAEPESGKVSGFTATVASAAIAVTAVTYLALKRKRERRQ